MGWKNQLTKTPYLVLFIVLGAVGITTASAVVNITLDGFTFFTEDVQMDNNLIVDGTITGKTINDLKQENLDIQNSISFLDIVVVDSNGQEIITQMGNGDGTFNDAPRVDSGRAVRTITNGDLNNDGHEDVVVANGALDLNLDVGLGKGDGTFTLTSLSVGPSNEGVAIGDLNNDGDQDIVASVGANLVAVLLGNGDGTFVRTDVTVGSAPSDVAIGDLNNDGDQDVVVVNEGDDDISVLLGNGDGTFNAQTDVAVGDIPNGVAIEDLNNDGDGDVVVANRNHGDISVLLGNGDGTFVRTDVGVGSTPSDVAIGDLTNDGDMDVVVTNQGHDDISVLLGNGDGAFVRTDVAVGFSPTDVAIGDLNNDGHEDVVVGHFSTTFVDVLLSNGDGTFVKSEIEIFGVPRGVAIGDFGGKSPLDFNLVTPMIGSPLGLSTGEPYSISCPQGSLVVGVQGRIAAAMDDIQLVCRQLERPSVGVLGPIFSNTDSFSKKVTNSDGGNFFRLDCTVPTEVSTGLVVLINPVFPNNVHDIKIRCTNLSTGASFVSGPAADGSGVSTVGNCVSNKVLTGINGFFGPSEFVGINTVNQIKIVCG